MSALVPLKLEAATAGTVFDLLTGGSVTWSDISDFVLFRAGISTSRGRRSESDNVSTGSLTFTVKTKHDGTRVDLAVRQPVRLSWYDAVTYDELAALFSDYADYAAAVAAYEDAGGTGEWKVLWTGSVSEIRQGWERGVRGVQEVSCTDNVAVAERTTLEGWATQYALSFGDLDWLFPLDDRDAEGLPREASGASVVPQLVARAVGVPADNSAVTFGQGAGPGGEGSAVGFTGDADGGYCLTVSDSLGRLPSGLQTQTVSVFVKPSQIGRAATAFSGTHTQYSTELRVDLGIDADGKGYVYWTTPGGGDESVVGTTVLAADTWHHLAFTVTEGGGGVLYDVELFVDGTEEGTAYSSNNGPVNIGAWGFRLGAGLAGSNAWAGQIAHAAKFAQVLTATEIGDLADVTGGFVGESTLARFNRIQRLAGFSTSTASGGVGTMGLQSIAGKSVAAVCNEVSTVEHAPWYATRTGTLTMASRADRYNAGAADVTLPSTAINPGTSITVSDAGIANRITVSRPGGFTTTLTDQASVDEFGIYPRSVAFAAGSDAEAETYAAALLKGAAQPDPETDSLTVDVSTVAATVTTTATGGADVGTLIEVTGLPTDAVAMSTLFWVEGVADRFGTTGWTRTYNTSAAAADTSVWVLGTAADDELGTDTRLGL